MKYLALLAVIALLAGCATPYPEPQVELAHTPVVNLPQVQPAAPTRRPATARCSRTTVPASSATR
jgi:uncharacterized lipoprotein YajG